MVDTCARALVHSCDAQSSVLNYADDESICGELKFLKIRNFRL